MRVTPEISLEKWGGRSSFVGRQFEGCLVESVAGSKKNIHMLGIPTLQCSWLLLALYSEMIFSSAQGTLWMLGPQTGLGYMQMVPANSRAPEHTCSLRRGIRGLPFRVLGEAVGPDFVGACGDGPHLLAYCWL